MIRVQFRAAIGSHTKIACSGEKGKKRKSERANAREIKGRELEEGVNARAKENALVNENTRREREFRWWSFQARAIPFSPLRNEDGDFCRFESNDF